MTGIIPTCSAPETSSASSVGAASGGSDAKPCQSETPTVIPVAVTPRIPMSAAPGTERAESATIALNPSRVSTGPGAISSPVVTIFAGRWFEDDHTCPHSERPNTKS